MRERKVLEPTAAMDFVREARSLFLIGIIENRLYGLPGAK
jgi:hypothetical protein